MLDARVVMLVLCVLYLMVYNNDYLEEPRMPKNEIEDEEHIDRDGRKYYTA